jgi:nitrite reductase/ring-hydroxylating ferredoxin subunit
VLGGYIGGHVVFSMGTAVNRNAFYNGSEEFVEVGTSDSFPENELRRVMVEDLPALVVRQQGKLCAIGAVCSHAGGPLDEGTLENGRVTCPWHGSIFDVCTGAVKGGPATFPEPELEVREADGRVSLKPSVPLH